MKIVFYKISVSLFFALSIILLLRNHSIGKEVEKCKITHNYLRSELEVNIKSVLNNVRFENTTLNKKGFIIDDNTNQLNLDSLVADNAPLLFIGLSQNNCLECKVSILNELRKLCKTTNPNIKIIYSGDEFRNLKPVSSTDLNNLALDHYYDIYQTFPLLVWNSEKPVIFCVDSSCTIHHIAIYSGTSQDLLHLYYEEFKDRYLH